MGAEAAYRITEQHWQYLLPPHLLPKPTPRGDKPRYLRDSLLARWTPLDRPSKLAPPSAEDRDEYFVRSPAEDAHHGVAILHCQLQAPEKQAEADNAIRPGIKRPLTSPYPHPGVAEWPKIVNRPQIDCGRPARSKKIAKQMQMDHEEREQKHPSAFPREAHQAKPNQQCAEKPVEQQVMVLLIIEKVVSSLQDLPGDIDQHATAIQVG